MNILITTEAPDGTVEHLDAMGHIITEEESLTNPIVCADETEAQIIAEYAAKRWSARQDCFIRNLKWKEIG